MLVEEAKAGNQAAMEALYQETGQRVYALALRLTGDPDQAMDVVQESYLSALEHLDSLRNPNAFMSWMFQIAANRCRKIYRQNRRFAALDQGEDDGQRDVLDTLPDPDEKLLPEAAADSDETRRLVMELVDSLPEAQRECVILYYFSECSVEQIAQIQGCAEGTVKSRLNYGRKKLKEGVLALEERDGIRLHSLAPIGLLLACVGNELPEPTAFLHTWQNIMAGMGAAGTAAASAGAAYAAVGEGAGAAAGGQTAAVSVSTAAKGAMGALKFKIAAGVAVAVVVAGGAGIALSQSPAITFSDPAFEQNIRVILDKPFGPIRARDLEGIYTLSILDEGMNSGIEGAAQAEAGTLPVSSLEDVALLPKLEQMNYQVDDGGAILNTLPEQESIQTLWANVNELDGTGVEDLAFLERLPALRRLYLHTAAGTELGPVEEKTSLMGLSLIPDEDTVLDISQLTQLRFLDYWGSSELAIALETTAELPDLRSLSLPGGSAFTTSLDVVSYMPALEYICLNGVEDTDLTPLAQLSHLRAIQLSYNGCPVDLTPLAQCADLEVCSILNESDAEVMTIPAQLPLEIGDVARSREIYQEVFREIGQEITD